MKTRKEQMTVPGAIDGYHNYLGADDSDYKDGKAISPGVLKKTMKIA